MTTSRLEGDLQRQIIRWLKRHHVWHLKVVGSAVQTGGVPDILVCYKSRFIALELKRPDGKGILADRQRAHLDRIEKNGGIGVVIDDYDKFLELMESIEEC